MTRLTLSSWMIVIALLIGVVLPIQPQPAEALTTADLSLLRAAETLGSGGVKWPQIATNGARVAAVGSFSTGSNSADARLFVKSTATSAFPAAVWGKPMNAKNDFATAGVAMDDNGNIYVARADPGVDAVTVTRHSSSGAEQFTWTIRAGPWPTNPALAIGKGSSSNRLMLMWRDDGNGDDKPAPYIAWSNNATGGGSFTAPQRLTDNNDKSSVWAPGIAPAPNGDFAFTWGRYDPRPMKIWAAVWRVSGAYVSSKAEITGNGGAALHSPSVSYDETGSRMFVAYRGDVNAWVTEMNPQSGATAPTVLDTDLLTTQQVDGRVNVASDDEGRQHFAFSAGPRDNRGSRQIYYGVRDGNDIVGQLGGYYKATGTFQNPFAAASRNSGNSYLHVVFEAHVAGTPQMRVVTFEAPPPYGSAPVLSAAKVGGSTTTVDVDWTEIAGRPNGIRYGWQTGATAATTQWDPDWTAHGIATTSRSATLTIPIAWQTAAGCPTRTFRSEFRKSTSDSQVDAWDPVSSTDTLITDYHVGASTFLSSTTEISLTTTNKVTTTMAIWGDRVTVRPRALLDTSLTVDGDVAAQVVRAGNECSNLSNLRVGTDQADADAAAAVALGGSAASYTKAVSLPGYSGDGDYTAVLRVTDAMGNQRYYTHTITVDGTAPDVSAIASSPSFTATPSPLGDIVQDIELDLGATDLSDTVAVLVTTGFSTYSSDPLMDTSRNWRAFRAENVIDGSTLRLDGWSLANAAESATTNGSFNLTAINSASGDGKVYISLMDAAGNLSDPIELTVPTNWELVQWNIPVTFR